MPAAVFASSILVSTYMPLARHDGIENAYRRELDVSTHMPLARHDQVSRRFTLPFLLFLLTCLLRGMTELYFAHPYCSGVSTHMPLASHDIPGTPSVSGGDGFYSHASCEA